MKVITIGRDHDNDIVISDSKVSRHHLQIINDDGGFRIVDFDSTNGTFVNDRKISGETSLFANDVVRIGNTILPWQTYFAVEKPKNPIPLYAGIAGTAVAIALVVILLIQFNKPRVEIIKMHEKNGVRYIPMKINGQELDFVFDTGASSICISSLEASVLVKNGTLSRSDIIGEDLFMDATGRISVGAKINLKTVQIGNKELKNVEATVVENPNAACLLGQTVLSRFGKYTIDNQNNEIIFE